MIIYTLTMGKKKVVAEVYQLWKSFYFQALSVAVSAVAVVVVAFVAAS